MGTKTVIIETNRLKKGKFDRRTFSCQVLESGDSLINVLDDTRNQITRKRFTLERGCRLFDGDTKYIIQDITYLRKPQHPYLTVSRNPIS